MGNKHFIRDASRLRQEIRGNDHPQLGRLIFESKRRGMYVKQTGADNFVITRRHGEHATVSLRAGASFDECLEFLLRGVG
jgi:hypothetical protein